MNCLVVVAHPLNDSLCHYLAEQAVAHLAAKGHDVTVFNLYDEAFQPSLSGSERDSYYKNVFHSDGLHSEIEQLKRAERLVLVFPTWWFGFPAILKGWFDRVWAPGHAYDHASDLGPILPRLSNLREMNVVTTLGSPWWVDWFVLRRPVRRVLKLALLGACSRGCRFKMLSLYNSEMVSRERLGKFLARLKSVL